MQGSLPWQGTKGEKSQAYVCEKKLSVDPEVLCDGLPISFKECLQYPRSSNSLNALIINISMVYSQTSIDNLFMMTLSS